MKRSKKELLRLRIMNLINWVGGLLFLGFLLFILCLKVEFDYKISVFIIGLIIFATGYTVSKINGQIKIMIEGEFPVGKKNQSAYDRT